MKKKYVLIVVLATLFNWYTSYSQCAQVAPYVEDFEAAAGSTPSCWTETGTDFWEYDNSAPAFGHVGDNGTLVGSTASGGYFAWVDDSDTAGSDRVMLESPNVDISGLTTPALKFYWVSNNEGNANSTLDVEVDDGSGWSIIASYSGNTGASPGEWVQEVLDLSAYSGSIQVRFAVSDSGSFYDDIAIDDIAFENGPSCYAPSMLNADVVLDTSATISWTGNASSYDVEYGPAGFTPTGTPTNSGVASNTYPITGLSPQTPYDVYVRADCGGGDTSAWVGPISFETVCQAVSAPFVEDFEVSAANLPGCWGLAGDEDWEFADDTGSDHIGDNGVLVGSTASGGYFAFVDDSNTAGTEEAILESPLIDLSGLSKPGLTFYWVSNNEGNSNSTLTVEVNDGSGWNTARVFSGNTGDSPGEWIEETLGLTAYSGVIQLRFVVTDSGSFYDDIAIDDITVKDVLCVPPSNLEVLNVTETTAELNWVADPSIVGYNVQVVPEGAGLRNIATDTGVANPYVKTGLDPNTSYDFYVQPPCSNDWVGPFTFTTVCPVAFEAPWSDDVEGHMAVEDFADSRCWTANSVSDFSWNISDDDTPTSSTGPSSANSGSNFFYVESNDGAQGDEAELVSPLVDLSVISASNPVLSFYYHMFGAEIGELHVDVNDGNQWDSDVLVLSGGFQSSDSDEWEQAFVDLGNYTGASEIQLRFRAVKGAGELGDIALDDFSVTVGDSCLPPFGVSVSDLGGTFADFNWLSDPGVSSWNIELVQSGSTFTGVPTVTGLTTTSYSATGLDPTSNYELYVQSDCGSSKGDWVGPISFTTTCVAEIPAYLEDFTSYLPNCWEVASAGSPSDGPSDFGSSSWEADEFLNTGSNMAVNINLWTTGKEEWLISPVIDLSGGAYELAYTAAITDFANSNPPDGDGMGDDDEVQVLITEDGGATWQNLRTYNQNSYPSATGSQEVIALGAYTGMVRIAFWATEGTNNDLEDYDFFIDDFEIRTQSPCPLPGNLLADNITGSSAELSWSAPGGNEVSWDVEVVPAGTQPTGVPTDPGVSSPYIKTGLSAASSYEFYVRADCGATDGVSVWAGPYAFNTACGSIAAPFTETFASSATPNCWAESGDAAWDYSTGADYAAAAAGDHTAGGGTNYAWMDGSDNTNDEVSSLTTPEIDLSSLFNPILEFYVFSANDDHTGVNPLDVEIYDGVNWVLVETINTLDNSWRKYSVNVANEITVSGNIKVRFTVTGDDTEGFTFNNDVLIDDVSVIESPACIEPGALDALNITSTSAELSWSSQGNEVSWDVEVVEEGTAPTGTPTDTNVTSPFVKTGLDPNTSYDFYVRAFCGAGDGYSTWAGPFTFTTLCEVIVAPYMQSFVDASIPDCWSVEGDNPDAWMFSTGADNAASDAGDHTSGNTNYAWVDGDDNGDGETASLVSPLMDLSSLTVPSLEFYMFSDNTDDAAINEMEVEFYDGANWNTLDTFTNLLGSNWYRFVFDLSTYTISGDVQFRFTVTGAANGGDVSNHDILIDDIVVDEMPNPCLEPEQVSIFNHQLDQVDIAWLDFNNSTSWTIEYGPQGFVQGNGTTETVSSLPFTIDNLSSGTEYDVYVQTDCGGGSTSDWVKASFEPLVIGARCDVAIDITNLPYNFTGNTGDYQNWYSGEPGSDCGTSEGYLNGNETVYKYTAANDDLVDIKLSNISGLYASLFVYESCEDIGDSCVAGVVAGPTEMDLEILEFEMVSGQEYIVVVSSWLNPSVDYTLDIIPFDCSNFEAPEGEANQEFVTGETVADLEVEGTKSDVTFKYYDANGNQLAETDVLVDGETYDVVQVFQGCDSAALSITVSEIDCSSLAITSTTDGFVNCLGTVELSATASGTGSEIYWYDDATGGELVAMGDTFTTPSLSSTTSYWATEVSATGTTASLGPADPSIGSTSTSTIDIGTQQLFFDVISQTTILSVDVYPNSSIGTVSGIEIRDANNQNTIAIVPYTVQVTGGNTPQTISLNVTLSPGSYEMGQEDNNAASLTRNTTGASYPYISPELEITGNSFDVDYYYFFYNWSVSSGELICESPRQEVIATVNQSGDELVDYTDLPYVNASSTAIYGNNFSGDPGANCSGANYLDGNDVIYQYSADPNNDDILTIELSGITNPDTGIYLYSSCGLIGLDCLDGLTNDGATTVTFEDYYMNAGEQLFIVISSESGSTNYTLSINGVDCSDVTMPTVESTSPYFVNGNSLSNVIPTVGLDGSVYNEGFTWYDDQGLTNVIDPDQEIITSGKSYYVTQTILGCESDAVVINPVEFDCSGLSISTDVMPSLCAPGGEVTLTANSSGTGSYIVWYSDENSGIILGTGETLIINIDRTSSVWVSEIFTRDAAVECATQRVEVQINVNYTPTQAPAGNAVQEFCDGARVSDIEITGTEVIWYADEFSDNMVPSNELLVDGEIYYASQIVDGCESEQRFQVTVDVKETSSMPNAPINQSFELGETLADLQVQGNGLNWYADEFGINPIPTPANEVLEDQETYYVSQTLNGECESELVGITVHVGGLDVDNIVFENLTYYPNPASHSLFITNTVSIDNIEVYSLLGQKLMTKNINNLEAEIDISHLASGSYMVKVSVDNKSTIIKILKE